MHTPVSLRPSPTVRPRAQAPVSRRQVLQAASAGWAAATVGSSLGAATAAVARVPSPPSDAAGVRLITVGGALTEIVYALGLEGLLVGSDTTSLYPPAAQQGPKVGYLRQLSAEGVLSLKPTALVTTTEAGPPVVLDQLRGAGVVVEQVQADHSWDEVRRKVVAVGRATGQAHAAQTLWQRLDAQWQQTQATVQREMVARQARGRALPRVVFILAHSGSPQAAGEGTAADAVIRYMGGRNALAGTQGFQGYKALNAEALAAAAPEWVLTTTQGLHALGGEAALWQRPELQLTPAYRRRASGSLLQQDALALLGFGPRMPALVAQMARQVLA